MHINETILQSWCWCHLDGRWLGLGASKFFQLHAFPISVQQHQRVFVVVIYTKRKCSCSVSYFQSCAPNYAIPGVVDARADVEGPLNVLPAKCTDL